VNFGDPFGLCPFCLPLVDSEQGIMAPGLGIFDRQWVLRQALKNSEGPIAIVGMLSGGGEVRAGAAILERLGTKLTNQLTHLTPRDLSAAAAELRGVKTGWHHVTEVRLAARGLQRTMKDLVKALARDDLTAAERLQAQQTLDRAKTAYRAAQEALR
jgi:hypothetical protein